MDAVVSFMVRTCGSVRRWSELTAWKRVAGLTPVWGLGSPKAGVAAVASEEVLLLPTMVPELAAKSAA